MPFLFQGITKAGCTFMLSVILPFISIGADNGQLPGDSLKIHRFLKLPMDTSIQSLEMFAMVNYMRNKSYNAHRFSGLLIVALCLTLIQAVTETEVGDGDEPGVYRTMRRVVKKLLRKVYIKWMAGGTQIRKWEFGVKMLLGIAHTRVLGFEY